MVTDTDYKQIVQELGERLGSTEAHNLLTSQKISPSTATKLLKGTYPSEVGPLLGSAIVRAERAAKKKRTA